MCILFLASSEIESLGAFVKVPFTNYNKSTELLEKHSKKVYHLRAMDMAYAFQSTHVNPQLRIDSRLTDINSRIYKFNSEVVPSIVKAVITCARQRIALQGDHQDKIDFSELPQTNEGNFVALIRLLAEHNVTLSEHLKFGARNARYVSKTIQNEILDIAADQIRDFYRSCLEKCPHFAVIADEVSSHGQEILCVCLRFLEIDSINFQKKPLKHECLLDFHFLERITGEYIATSILAVLNKHKIEVKNCKGQAYDTTASMSSPSAGVQAYIKKAAPDADYQGCCLHSLNLVICTLCKIPAVQNMFDSCQQAYLYFRNSPKRQRFLEHIIESTCPTASRKKISGLCKTRWVERHNTFSTILELYPFLVKTWNEICYPTSETNSRDWKWDSESRTMANGLSHTFASFEHIVTFIIAKEVLEPIRPIAESLQGRLQEVYFGFGKIDAVKSTYIRIRDTMDFEHDRIYSKACKLAEEFGTEEHMPRVAGRQRNRSNPTVTSPKEYWRVTVTIPLVDSIISEVNSRFSVEKRAHFELCALIPAVISRKDNLLSTCEILLSKWRHIMPASDNFESELHRWKEHCLHITEDKSVTALLSEDADPIFFPNVRELLCILGVLPVGSAEAERSFSSLRQIHTWLRTNMTNNRLGNLGVIAHHGFDIHIDVNKVCATFISANASRMSSTPSILCD